MKTPQRSEGARPIKPRTRRQAGRAAPYLIPLIVVLGLSSLLPIAYSVVFSLFDWQWGSRLNFVGLANYIELLGNGEYWASLARTALFTIAAVSFELVVGLCLALAVFRVSRGVGWIRTLFIAPLMVSGIVVGLVWKVMLDPTLGVVPYLLGKLGWSQVDLLGSETTALVALAGIDTWWQTGFVFIILSAGLAGLSHEPFEAASVDGAGPWQRFIYLTMPMMLPLIGTVAAIRSVDCLKVFALSFSTTNGGPNHATDFTQLLAYRTAFRQFNMSESMTMMITYTLIIIVVVVVATIVRSVVRHAR